MGEEVAVFLIWDTEAGVLVLTMPDDYAGPTTIRRAEQYGLTYVEMTVMTGVADAFRSRCSLGAPSC